MAEPHLTPPGAVDRIFNRVFSWFVARGLAPANFYMLDVRGRKTGKIYSTPVDLLRFGERDYLVAPRGNTQWVRNARASGEVILRQGKKSEHWLLSEVADGAKPTILKSYLDTYSGQVQRFFPVRAGSPPEAFVPLVCRYPCFEIRRAS